MLTAQPLSIWPLAARHIGRVVMRQVNNWRRISGARADRPFAPVKLCQLIDRAPALLQIQHVINHLVDYGD
jgi:hypothetical protein